MTTALLRYQTDLLLRSQRWLAPLLLYAVFLVVGVRAGEPVLGALGFAAAALLPVTAWVVRICLGQEPAAARNVVAAAAGRQRAHVAAVLAAVACAAPLGAVAVLGVTAVSDLRGIGSAEALASGLLATTACVLTGAAVGTLTTRPLLRSQGWSLAALVLGSLLALVTSGSPAKYAVTGLITGARTATVTMPWAAALGALVLAAVAVAVSVRATAWRE
ncbi:ABC transporter [Streptomyces sp. NPDC048370]|uniref:ABC transporter n=1 Tax=Streptomyces sp. NPDC048370 TaxID=3365540 RepID=UPI003716D58F